MILDTSAVVAMVRGEPEAKSLSWKMDRAAVIRIGAPTLVEATVVLIRRHDLPGHTALTEFLRERKVTTIPFGSRHWYAAARIAKEPLLFVGDDFAKTDIPPA